MKNLTGDKMKKNISILLILYTLQQPLSSAMSIIISPFIFQYVFIISILLLAIFICNFKINMKLILTYSILLILSSLNILLSRYHQFVIPDIINFLIQSSVPFYLLSTKKIDFQYISFLSKKISIVLTFLLPYYYFLRINSYISYFDFGMVCHIAIIYLSIFILTQTETNKLLLNYTVIFINLLAGFVFGSRTVILASILIVIIMTLLKNNSNILVLIGKITIMTTVSTFIVINIDDILLKITQILTKYNINSRNISLLRTFLNNPNQADLLSGRDSIYPIVSKYLAENGFFPHGFGMGRVLTNNQFYHTHNFFTEISLILGFPFAIIFILFLLYQVLYKTKKLGDSIYYFCVMFVISFAVRSIFGTHFITDQFFLIIMGISVFLYKNENSTRNLNDLINKN